MINAKEITKLQLEDLQRLLDKFNQNEATLEDVEQAIWDIASLLLNHLKEGS